MRYSLRISLSLLILLSSLLASGRVFADPPPNTSPYPGIVPDGGYFARYFENMIKGNPEVQCGSDGFISDFNPDDTDYTTYGLKVCGVFGTYFKNYVIANVHIESILHMSECRYRYE